MDDESILSQQLLSDTDLVEDFRARQDSETMERIVMRYGALVMGVCRRHTRNLHDAEDAFQATFVILVSNISKLRNPESIGSWLFGIAYRVSTRLNRKAAKQPESVESQGMEIAEHVDPFELVNARFVLAKTDEELQRLPEKLKRPMILRYLMGKSNQEIAAQLQTSVAAIEGRLKRAKSNLRFRLTRCGITLGTALIAVHKSQEAAAGWLNARLADSHAGSKLDLTQTGNISIEITQLAREETVMISSIIGSKSAVGIAASIALITTSVVFTAATVNGDGNGAAEIESNSKPAQPLLPITQPSPERESSTSPFESDPSSADPFADGNPFDPSTKTSNSNDPFDFDDGASASDDPFDVGDKASASDDPFGPAPADKTNADPNRKTGRVREKSQTPVATIRNVSETNGVQDMKVFPDSHQSVRDELKKQSELNFFETSLGDAIDFLKRSHAVNIRMDPAALEANGVSTDSPVQNITISGITFQEGLDLVLEEFDLTFVPRGNLIFITTPEKANRIHETHVYRLPQLSVSSQELVDLITSNVTPDLWESKKGYGKITPLQGRIVVRQTFRGHQELKELLKQLIQSEDDTHGENSNQSKASIIR